MCRDFLLLFIQSRLLSLSLILLYCKWLWSIRFLFYTLFAWRTHYKTLSLIPSSRNWKCFSRLHIICCRKIFGNIFLLCVTHCTSPCICFVLMIIRHLQWIRYTTLSFRMSVCFLYGLRMRKIGLNVYWLPIWKKMSDTKDAASNVFV